MMKILQSRTIYKELEWKRASNLCLDMTNKCKTIHVVRPFVLVNSKEMEKHLRVSMSFTVNSTRLDYVQQMLKN